MAGGTDLLVQIKGGKRKPQCVVDLKGIEEMEGIRLSGGELWIGALTRIREIETSDSILRNASLLACAAAKLGSVQVRYRATIGGNLCNASPSAETAPALLVLDAQAVICGRAGTRIVPLERFFSGPGATVLREDEILTGLKIPLSGARRGAVYYKLSARKAMDLAFVGVAVRLEVGGEGCITKARIALGAVAPMPIRALPAEKVLEGAALSPEAAREAAEQAAQCSKPISDHRASAEYRREMVRELCERGVIEAYAQATSVTKGKNG
jgi:CO/xanthine dehydrogenase FAD-binding subunit